MNAQFGNKCCHIHIHTCDCIYIHSLIIIILCAVLLLLLFLFLCRFLLNLRRMCVIQIHGHKNVQVKSICSQTCWKISAVISVENHFIEFYSSFLVDILFFLLFLFYLFSFSHTSNTSAYVSIARLLLNVWNRKCIAHIVERKKIKWKKKKNWGESTIAVQRYRKYFTHTLSHKYIKIFCIFYILSLILSSLYVCFLSVFPDEYRSHTIEAGKHNK